MVSISFASALATVVTITTMSDAAFVDPGVHRALKSKGESNLIITMEKPIASPLSVVEDVFNSREERIEAVVKALRDVAKSTQKEVEDNLNAQAEKFRQYKSHWISNSIYVEGATEDVVNAIANLQSVNSVAEEIVLPLPVLNDQLTDVVSNLSDANWGVEMINAPKLWDSGNTGEGVIVATIDSGVRGTHEALKGNFIGDFGWFDPYKKSEKPNDSTGHGTHTMGIIAGSNGIGVAPGAGWMACKGCRPSGCYQSDLLACGEYIACPHDTNGENEDCSKAPHIINNSWGGGSNLDFYEDIVEAWHSASIIPVMSNGNRGPICSTATSPGDYPNVISVGNTDKTDGLNERSSRGPGMNGKLKPEISAPGTDIKSAWSTGDDAYSVETGTSMAAPHVSGAIALMIAAKGDMEFDDVLKALTSTAVTEGLAMTTRACGGIEDGTFPNNHYGYGRLNIEAAIDAA